LAVLCSCVVLLMICWFKCLKRIQKVPQVKRATNQKGHKSSPQVKSCRTGTHGQCKLYLLLKPAKQKHSWASDRFAALITLGTTVSKARQPNRPSRKRFLAANSNEPTNINKGVDLVALHTSKQDLKIVWCLRVVLIRRKLTTTQTRARVLITYWVLMACKADQKRKAHPW
jgi:hypothetical protein